MGNRRGDFVHTDAIICPCTNGIRWTFKPIVGGSRRNGKVTPKVFGSPNNRWEFSIVLDTHSSPLNDDLTQSATLTINDGRTFKPASWTGAPSGGHHREGVLAFDVPGPRPTVIELKIMRPGETAPRTFRWQF